MSNADAINDEINDVLHWGDETQGSSGFKGALGAHWKAMFVFLQLLFVVLIKSNSNSNKKKTSWMRTNNTE